MSLRCKLGFHDTGLNFDQLNAIRKNKKVEEAMIYCQRCKRLINLV